MLVEAMDEKNALFLLREVGCPTRVIEHCKMVASYGIEIADRINSERGDVKVDSALVLIGALLHDIGRAKTQGIRHAVVGGEIAKKYCLDERLIRIIERHIGAGITREEAGRLGLPIRDYIPENLEEKIVAYVDNLVLGNRRISLEERIAILREQGLGEEVIQRIKKLNDEIEGYLRL